MKRCSKCQNQIEDNENYCNRCGSYVSGSIENNQINSNIIYNNPNINFQNNNMGVVTYNNKQNADKLKSIFIGIGCGLVVVAIILFGGVIFSNINKRYYFNPNSYDDNSSDNNSVSTTNNSKYTTVIVYDNTYSGVKIANSRDALNLISKDSTSQKDKCPKEIKAIEDEIIKSYDITAVNLCEMDLEFAHELINVLKKVYTDYPSIKGYITNLTLVNASLSDRYIAAFMPVFTFATADTKSKFPQVIKTQVLLNTSYFLNQERLLAAVKQSTEVGHFPPNTTIYSPLAHELGHYLSFIAMMKSYKLDSILLVDEKKLTNFSNIFADFSAGEYSLKIINEAYEKYKKEVETTLTLDEWRGTISQYALAKDNNGKYIYDETIAEAFHDVYLNGENATDASKYIVNILKDKLGS